MDPIEAQAGDELYKAHVLTVDPPQGTSTQPDDDDPDLGTPEDGIHPPESIERLALWSAFNGTRRSCIEGMAKNTVGLGYELEVAEGHEQDDETDRVSAYARLEYGLRLWRRATSASSALRSRRCSRQSRPTRKRSAGGLSRSAAIRPAA